MVKYTKSTKGLLKLILDLSPDKLRQESENKLNYNVIIMLILQASIKDLFLLPPKCYFTGDLYIL